MKIRAAAIILAMGCRERTRGALNIPGYRPAGIYTAGAAQRFVNMRGYLPGKGSNPGVWRYRPDNGQTLDPGGCRGEDGLRAMPYSGGLTRNIVQCLEDYNIPLRLSHTVVDIHGKDRLEGVTIAAVDKNRQPIKVVKNLLSAILCFCLLV